MLFLIFVILAYNHEAEIFGVVVLCGSALCFGKINETDNKVAVKRKDLKFDPNYSVSILLRNVEALLKFVTNGIGRGIRVSNYLVVQGHESPANLININGDRDEAHQRF